MASLIIKLIIWTILFLIFFTFIAVLIRRFYMNRKYRLLDIERDKVAPFLACLSDGLRIDDIQRYRRKEGSSGWVAVEEAMFKALESPNALRQEIFRYFDELGYIESYITTLYRGNKFAQALAADKLGRIKCIKALPHLIFALKGVHKDIRNMAVYALGVINHEDAIPHLIERLRSAALTDEEVSIRIVKSSLISFGEAVIPKLLPEIRNQSWRIRSAAADILAELRPKTPIIAEAFMDALSDPEQDMRAKAAKGLGKLRYWPAIDRLKELLQDPFWVVRLHAARALGLIGDPVVIDSLREMLKDKNWQVRKSAAEALGKIGGRAYIVLLQVYLYSNDRYATEQVADEMERMGIIKEFLNWLLKKEKPVSLDSGDINKEALEHQRNNFSEEVFRSIAYELNYFGIQRHKEVMGPLAGPEFSPEEIDNAIEELARMPEREMLEFGEKLIPA
ncbi:MAG: HEAT repeat domain-containing protein [Deltaproteobacteria bacterium]|nr:HEAT repeat domain-containing protein [Deltaproteobacteria bacterium]